ncbi:uncharacterized protein [Clytia hemisphaerica]|uniref:Uncharacterized protein n=1 Tax=Clytia hemisphaerica TaxID=252671 RepID=A0A7M5VDS7_9CNID
MAGIAHRISLLQPKPIDPNKCTKGRSLYGQILGNVQTISKHQDKQYHLGNNQSFESPIQAAEYLLRREYGDTSLFHHDKHQSVFIPPVFSSSQFNDKESTTNILDYDVRKDLTRLADNLNQSSPDYWLTNELHLFVQSQKSGHFIDKNLFDQWILNLKMMYLVAKELQSGDFKLPSILADRTAFVQGCLEVLTARSLENADSTSTAESDLRTVLTDFTSQKSEKFLKRDVLSLIRESPPQDPNLNWIFGLELATIGERLEHWFFGQLLLLKDDILKDTVVLSSVNFMTNVRNKKHRELDSLIISWSRKLIISVEMKLSLKDEKVFDQLDQNHQIFEERLGDRFQPGWTFYPLVVVEHTDSFSTDNLHFMTSETEVKSRLENIFRLFPVIPLAENSTPIEDVKQLLQVIIFAVHVSKKQQVAPITNSNWVEYIRNAIDNVSTSKNIIFYSNQQMNLLNNPHSNKLIILGAWGTGKTIMLKQKAIQLDQSAEFQGKILYILGNWLYGVIPPTMLYHRTNFELKDYQRINIIEINEADENICQEIVQYITDNDIKAVFMDEFFMLREGATIVENIMNMVEVCWIIPCPISANKNNFKEWENDFKTLTLQKNFRNSQEITKMVKSFAEEVKFGYMTGLPSSLPNFPCGKTPLNVDSFQEAMTEARKLTKQGILVIMHNITRDVREILNTSNETWKIYTYQQNDFLDPEDPNPYQFLLDGNVLFADSQKLNGFEWQTVILVGTWVNRMKITHHGCNYMMRCTTNLIIVGDHNNAPHFIVG